MKTLEDFKGTKNLPEFKPMGIGGTFTLTYRHKSEKEADANSKLFANSYKLLEAAIQAKETLVKYESRMWEEGGADDKTVEELVNKSPLINLLQQAIQDCL